ncbi:hypothetical protein DAPPUDRAFT_314326 [Daphnia pulex]|uniref:Uncharacterized protein n=1 Tax=Daphnia pulex TaxID=6669 RepID=E9G6T2_DAPPU|nr:hypothetical protein DAPPUDRAFT_314326 [Daphnia pulex]|eukprot:EFX84800.1 hypothetical protein DAPPUDRAFT_314326 [Daphnia pulex]
MHAAPSYYIEAPNCYTDAPADYSTEAAKYYSAPIYTTTTEAAKYYAVPTYNREAALSCYVEQKYYTNAPVRYTTTYAKPQPPVYYTTTYATPSYNTAAPKYYTEEAACYTTTYAAYIEEFKYYPAPNYYHLKSYVPMAIDVQAVIIEMLLNEEMMNG